MDGWIDRWIDRYVRVCLYIYIYVCVCVFIMYVYNLYDMYIFYIVYITILNIDPVPISSICFPHLSGTALNVQPATREALNLGYHGPLVLGHPDESENLVMFHGIVEFQWD